MDSQRSGLCVEITLKSWTPITANMNWRRYVTNIILPMVLMATSTHFTTYWIYKSKLKSIKTQERELLKLNKILQIQSSINIWWGDSRRKKTWNHRFSHWHIWNKVMHNKKNKRKRVGIFGKSALFFAMSWDTSCQMHLWRERN